MNDSFELLLRKDIYQILDGDEQLDDSKPWLHMPYLSGKALCELSDNFGLHQEIGESRWIYLDNLFRYTIEKKNINKLLCYMFDIKRFTHLEEFDNANLIMEKYHQICAATIHKINTKLLLGQHELRCNNGYFYITDIRNETVLVTPKIKQIDIPYVQGLTSRCREDLLNANFDSVITKSRTIIEEVLIHILEKHCVEITSKGDIRKLFAQLKDVLNMKQNKDFDKRVNSLLSGLEKIVEFIGSMRNINSDAHGVGNSRIIIHEREARLAMNSAIIFCEYVLSVDDK